MSFRRHYGTGSYSSSLLTSPLSSSSYGSSSRGLGGYSSPYSTYGSGYSPYGGYGSKGSGGLGTGTTSLSRSASLPREIRDRSLPRYSAYSRGTSPARSTLSSLTSLGGLQRPGDFDSSDSSSSSGADINLKRSHTFSPGYTGRTSASIGVPRPPYAAKAYIRTSRAKSLGSESSGYGSRTSLSEKGEATKGSTSSLGSSALNSRPSSRGSSVGPENGDVDYKKLYEEQLEENFRVHERLRGTENELRTARENLETNNKKNNTRLAMAEADKREKRALERKLAEMEEELKLLEQLKQENQRLKDENGALIRVISKLSK